MAFVMLQINKSARHATPKSLPRMQSTTKHCHCFCCSAGHHTLANSRTGTEAPRTPDRHQDHSQETQPQYAWAAAQSGHDNTRAARSGSSSSEWGGDRAPIDQEPSYVEPNQVYPSSVEEALYDQLTYENAPLLREQNEPYDYDTIH